MPNTANGLPYPPSTGVPPNVPLDLQLLAEAVDPLALDSGWVDCTILGGFSAGSPAPQVRRIGKVVYLRGVMTNTGMSAATAHQFGTVPSGYRPVAATHVFTYASTANTTGGGRLQVAALGGLTLTTQATLGASYYLYGINWTVD